MSKDTAINHFPIANSASQDKYKKALFEKFGKFGLLFEINQQLEMAFSHRLSMGDHQPGSMISLYCKSEEVAK